MKALHTIIAATLIAAVPFAAQANKELATKKNCFACHQEEKKFIGPAYKDVAAKYKGNKDAEKTLVQSILKGSTGKWGQMPMPPNAVTEAEAQTLAKWVLTH